MGRPKLNFNCGVEGCAVPAVSKGYCNVHWKRIKTHGDPHKVISNKLTGLCEAPYCTEPKTKGLYCGPHYTRQYKTGQLDIKRMPNGHWSKGANGYMSGTRDGRRIYQHIWVAEQALGRKLKGTEEVHHVDGDKTNNTPTNLVICPNRAYHMLLHQRTRERSAHELMSKYFG